MTNIFIKEQLNIYLEQMLNNNNYNIEFVNLNKDEFNDYYQISITKGIGTITGNNERSILLGVYDLLRTLGCKFLIPGLENEIIPKITINDLTVNKTVKPRYKYRTICLEGATSIEHMLNMIDYLPKNGYNGYFIQFKSGHEFFQRWYEHKNNPFLLKEEYTYEQSIEYTKLAINEIKKRNLLFHSMGHGFTMEALGLNSTGWQEYSIDQINEEDREMLALVNGERNFFKGIPMNTQLCYSNIKVRNKMKDLVVNYLLENPHVDILHLWLADDFNNYCECEKCIKKMPSDYYIMLLNEIDLELTKLNLKNKIAFLAYYELLWPPQEERLINEDRFILMFAPITRTYTNSYDEIDYDNINLKEVNEFKLNKNVFPNQLADNLTYIKKWQEVFKGDSFLFDYHLMWDEFKDYPGLKLAKILHRDLEYLEKLGFDGFISCQVSRNFFPSAIAMNVMSKTLVEKTNYELLELETFKTLYGNNYQLVLNILNDYSNVLSHPYARKELDINNKEYLEKLLNNKDIKTKYSKSINDAILNEDNEIINNNLSVIKLFIGYVNHIYNIHLYKLSNSIDEMNKELNLLLENILTKEEKYSNYFDGFYLAHVLKEFVNDRW